MNREVLSVKPCTFAHHRPEKLHQNAALSRPAPARICTRNPLSQQPHGRRLCAGTMVEGTMRCSWPRYLKYRKCLSRRFGANFEQGGRICARVR